MLQLGFPLHLINNDFLLLYLAGGFVFVRDSVRTGFLSESVVLGNIRVGGDQMSHSLVASWTFDPKSRGS